MEGHDATDAHPLAPGQLASHLQNDETARQVSSGASSPSGPRGIEKRPSEHSVSATLEGVEILAHAGSWDAVARLVNTCLASEPLPHVALKLRLYRIVALLRLRQHQVAAEELKLLGDLDSPHHHFEHFPKLYPGKTGASRRATCMPHPESALIAVRETPSPQRARRALCRLHHALLDADHAGPDAALLRQHLGRHRVHATPAQAVRDGERPGPGRQRRERVRRAAQPDGRTPRPRQPVRDAAGVRHGRRPAPGARQDAPGRRERGVHARSRLPADGQHPRRTGRVRSARVRRRGRRQRRGRALQPRPRRPRLRRLRHRPRRVFGGAPAESVQRDCRQQQGDLPALPRPDLGGHRQPRGVHPCGPEEALRRDHVRQPLLHVRAAV
mmetsp:Transcript_19012/g.63689  ORF Transcript_19012/g.63689 Transcript_19012/m.63689 type:complete len:385 (+) Transcript_19012:56-1210(+)